MKKLLFILMLILVCSCRNENPYKKALEEKIKRNIKAGKPLIKVKLRLKYVESDFYGKYKEIGSLLHKLNNICNSFCAESLKINDINKVNLIRIKTLKEIKNLKTDYPEMQQIISQLNKPITNHLDKLECVYKVNELYLNALKLSIDKYSSGTVVNPSYRSPKPTRVHCYRVNDSLVSVLIANNIVIDYPYFFNNYLSFHLKSPNDKYLGYRQSACIASYNVYTKSDTLNFKATIKTTDTLGFILTDVEKNIVVGEVLELKTNGKEFMEMIYNWK